MWLGWIGVSKFLANSRVGQCKVSAQGLERIWATLGLGWN